MSRSRASGLLLLLAIGAAPGPSRAATPFVNETVEAAGDIGQYNSLRLDALGNPHISYYDATNGDLKYGSKSGTTWTIESVTASGNDVGQYSSLALDAQGNPHISYYDVTNHDLKYASKSGSLWTSEDVDLPGDVGQYSSLALDTQGNPHICYYDATNGDLKYASKSGSIWTTEIAWSIGNVGESCSLALDSQGRPHISFYGATNTFLEYAYKNGGSWEQEIVDNTAFTGFSTSIALDAKGQPHISYRGSIGVLWYASKIGYSNWTLETADGTTLAAWTSLALDATGTPFISYQGESGPVFLFKVTSKKGGFWTPEFVDVTGEVGVSSSIALDTQGNPCASYYDNTNGDLRYTDSAVHLLSPLGGERWAAGSQQTVRWSGSGSVSIEISQDGGTFYLPLLSSISSNAVVLTAPAYTTDRARIRVSRGAPYSTSDSPGYFLIAPDLVRPWWARTADAGGDVGAYTSLALDAQGNPRASHFDNTSFDLKYASKNGGVWTAEVVDATGTTGLFTSLALDASSNPRISYYDLTNGDLRYASKSSGVWTPETVDATGDVGGFTSLALDAQGNPRISYTDGTNGDLKYASKSGSVWTPETVDATGDVGAFTSLALDGQGNPRISYYDTTNGDLKYASKSGGPWTVETVDAAGDVGAYSSLALDTQGNPCISYYDFTNGNLKYASKSGGAWTLETVDATGDVGRHTSLAVDALGNPRISYDDDTNSDLKYASRSGGVWMLETVDATGSVGLYTSLALDAQGNPRITYYDAINLDLKYASAAIEVSDPAPAVTWPVGARRTVRWDGTGRVDLYLSTDGGNTWALEAGALTGGEYRLTVPHTPSHFCKVGLNRAVPYSLGVTDSFFTIQVSVSLLSLLAAPPAPGGSGAVISWQTDPGPSDLAGYRLERASGGGDWTTLVALTRETSYADPAAGPATRYRLFAVNGLGEELMLGETSLRPMKPLAAWPLPYRGGKLSISFATFGGLGGGIGPSAVSVFDVTGRLVRTVARGSYAAGYQTAVWDGLDAAGRKVAGGIYLLRAESAGQVKTLKLVVLR